MRPGWTRLGSAARDSRGTLTLREDPGGCQLRDEGGYRAMRLEFLTRFYPSNACLDEVAYCYAAYGLTEDPLPTDHDEFLERRIVPLAEAVRMTLAGEFTESVSKVARLQHAAMSPRQ